MKQILNTWVLRGALIAGLTFAGLTPMLTRANAAPADGIRFRVGSGGRSSGYPIYGRGGYGYRPNVSYGYQPYRSNTLPVYGYGPYGYGTQNSSVWNQNYAPYGSYYNSSYYNSSNWNPYSSWNYSPFGVGYQRSYYGW